MRRETSRVINPHAADSESGVGRGENVVPASAKRTLLSEAGVHAGPGVGEMGGSDINPAAFLNPARGLSK
eukprot:3145265-Alexandrium_andersonii.AAC.1